MGETSRFLRLIRDAAQDKRHRDCSDADLLFRFIADRDEESFQALLRRHGTMVLQVCRGVLANESDVEDAFQATFLVLARRAEAIRNVASVASWLHGVAYRVALKARAQSAVRRQREACAPERTPSGGEDFNWSDVQFILHEELNRLSDSHRAPLVLCYLQGRTQDEAATLLGLSKGTLKRRLERGRALLRGRLVRRGLGTLGVLVLSAWPPACMAANIPPSLMAATVDVACRTALGEVVGTATGSRIAALADDAIRSIAGARVKVAALVVMVSSTLALAGALGWRGLAHKPTLRPGNPPVVAVDVKEHTDDVVRRFAGQLKQNPPRDVPVEGSLGLYLLGPTDREATLIPAALIDARWPYCGSPCWSGDGRHILFDSSPGQQFDQTCLQSLELHEGGLVLSSLGRGNCPAVSPDGMRVAFLLKPGEPGDAKPGCCVMNVDGTGRRWLGNHQFGNALKWSPDGRHLLVVTNATPAQLTLLDVETGVARPVQLPPDQRVYSVPSWAEDGTLVAVVTSGRGSIVLVDVRDPERAEVKTVLWRRGEGLNVEPAYPVYSPRERRCYFVGREPTGQALYTFEVGSQPQRMEAGGLDGKIASLALAPDGRHLLFCSDRLRPGEAPE